MICPECGERYNFYEPRCPWCGAAKPVEKEKPDEGEKSPGYQVEKAPEKEVLLSYKCQKEYKGKFRIVSNYISFAVCLLVFFVIMGVIAVEPVGIKGWFFLFCFFIGCVALFVDPFYSARVVREIKCCKDEFVLCACFEKTNLPFDQMDLWKKRYNILGRRILVFYKNEGIFFIDERDFPEVVEMMDKLYFGKG